jgi:hypothetical protein
MLQDGMLQLVGVCLIGAQKRQYRWCRRCGRCSSARAHGSSERRAGRAGQGRARQGKAKQSKAKQKAVREKTGCRCVRVCVCAVRTVCAGVSALCACVLELSERVAFRRADGGIDKLWFPPDRTRAKPLGAVG